MKYFCIFILLFANVCFADKSAKKPDAVTPNNKSGETYIDPYDVGTSLDPNDIDGSGFADPYDDGLIEDEGQFIDPYDYRMEIEKKPDKQKNPLYQFKDDLFAGTDDFFEETSKSTGEVLTNTNKNWIAWKQLNLHSPKPPLEWSQVGTEIGAGYAGAFIGSVAGVFSGFLIGSVYDAVSSCEQCWVDVAVSMSTLGATFGASAGVYMFGNNEKQVGSPYATYAGAVLPVFVGAIAYRGSNQLKRSGFYLATMPLMAAVGFNLTRHYRKKGEKTLFDDFFADDLWVSKGRDDVLALNVRWNLD